MKRLALAVVLFTVVVAASWPYVNLWRLDRAVTASDMRTLAELVDMEAVRAGVKARVGERVASTLGGSHGSLLGWIQEGVQQIGDRAVDLAIDLEWVRDTLSNRGGTETGLASSSLLDATTYAFYEGWDRFLVRVGRLDRNPLHVRMALRGWRWRVIGIYD